MFRKSSTGIIHQIYYSKPLSKKHGHHIYLTICRNMPTNSKLWTRIQYHELPSDFTPCKLCLTKLESRIGFSIREYCRLFGHDLNSAFIISENTLPVIILRIKGE